MRKHLATMIVAGVGVFAALAGTSLEAQAQSAQPSETDRLRDALRSATSTVRSLEDERTAVQAKLAEAQRERDGLKKDVTAAKAKIKEVERDYRQAVTDFNDRLEERNQTLEKWKDAYEEAASVARGKDAERAKAAAEALDYKARTNACIQKNQELVKVGRDLLTRYEGVTFGDKAKAQEPFTRIGRVQMQTLLQTYGDKILNQKIQP